MKRVNGKGFWSWALVGAAMFLPNPLGAAEGRGAGAASLTPDPIEAAQFDSSDSLPSSFTLYIFYAGMVALVPDAGMKDPVVLLPKEDDHVPYLRVFLKNVNNFCDRSRCCPAGAISIKSEGVVVQCWWKLESVELGFSPAPKKPKKIESPRAGYSRFPANVSQAGSPDWIARMSVIHRPFSEINRLTVLKNKEMLAAFSTVRLGELLSCHLATSSNKLVAYRFLNPSNTGYRKIKAVSDAVVSRLHVEEKRIDISLNPFPKGSISVTSLIPHEEDKEGEEWRLDIAITNLPEQDMEGDDRGHFKRFYRLAARPQGPVMSREPMGAASTNRSIHQPNCESKFLSLCGKRGEKDGLSYSNEHSPIDPPPAGGPFRNICSRPVCPLAIFEPIDPSRWGGS